MGFNSNSVLKNFKEGNMKLTNVGCLLCSVMIIFTASCGKIALSSDKAKASYGMGMRFGKEMKARGMEIDMTAFNMGADDGLNDKKSRVTDEELNAAFQKLTQEMMKNQQEKAEGNKKIGDDYLLKNKVKAGVIVTQSGLQYKVLKEGIGNNPKPTDQVKVHYRGKLIDGTEFDSSYKRKQPAEFQLNQVIPGWSEGLQLMKVGSKYELTVPSTLGYGERGNQSIPGNSVLIFEVELLDIKPGVPANMTPGMGR
jgi:FKBP-type peptidyl-prolyl cis-trans isomerase